MSVIQRYDRTSLSMWPSEDGLYVRYSDHEAEVASLRAELQNAAPPAQAVDLEQFRRVAKYAKYWADEKGNDEVGAAADRLLALIDEQKEARNG